MSLDTALMLLSLVIIIPTVLAVLWRFGATEAEAARRDAYRANLRARGRSW